MKRHIIISIIGHLLVFAALIMPAFLPTRPMPPVQMVTVRAVTPQSISQLLERAEEPAQPPPEPKVPEVVVPKDKLITPLPGRITPSMNSSERW